MKALTKILAVTAATLGVISAAGCASAPRSAKTVTSANWNVRTNSSAEGDFTEGWLENTEVAEYDVTFKEGVNGTYSLNYTDGKYTTEFGMTHYDWSVQNDLPEGYAPESNVNEPVYVYRTKFEIKVKYTFKKTGDTAEFTDSVNSVCYYRLAGDNLQPVYSKQEIKNTPPNALSASSLENAYVKVDGVYETFYNYDCTKATIFHTNNLTNTADCIGVGMQEVSVSDKEGHSVFDNSQLRAAVRAFNLSGGASHTFNVLVPQNGGIQSCTATSTSPVKLDKGDEEQAKIIQTLKDSQPSDYIFFDDTVGEGEEERDYRFTAVSLGINADSPMTGSYPVLWYSTVENNEINYSKSVLLKMSTPISFGLGTLNYTLKSLNVVANS